MAPQNRRGGDHCCRVFLRGSLRALNYMLAIIGVLMVAYSLFMYVQWSEASPDAPPSPPAPEPAPGPSALPYSTMKVTKAAYRASSIFTFNAGHFPDTSSGFMGAHDAHPSRPWLFFSEDESSGSMSRYPWFIYLFGGAGMFVFVTASIGILSADCAACGVTCFLGLYHALMVMLLLLQICVLCFYFFDKSWEEDLPPDSTGEYAKLRDFVQHSMRTCQMVGLATIGLQILALMVSCSLYYAENKPRPGYQDLADYDRASQASLTVRNMQRRNAGSTASGPRAAAAHAPWRDIYEP